MRRAVRSRRRAVTAPALLVLGLLAACTNESFTPSVALQELERLAFVPASGPQPTGAGASLFPRAMELALPRPLLVDRFELTRRDSLRLGVGWPGEADGAPGFVTDAAQGGQGTLDWPAFLTYAQAEELGRRRGMRLPTPAEWLHVATDGGRLLYPYHALISQRGFANTYELGLGQPAPVGSFENGRSRHGCYDLHGNVAEWVDGAVPGHKDNATLQELAEASGGRPLPTLASAMGGSFAVSGSTTFRRSFQRVPLTFLASLLDKQTLRPAVGARHVADAASYLREQADAWGRDPSSRSRIRAVGAVWANAAGRARVVPFLVALAEAEGAPPNLRELLRGARGEEGR